MRLETHEERLRRLSAGSRVRWVSIWLLGVPSMFQGDLQPYRVGLGSDLARLRMYFRSGDWWGIPITLRTIVRRLREGNPSYRGFWQVEWPGCGTCPRGYTRAHALFRAKKRIAFEQQTKEVPS